MASIGFGLVTFGMLLVWSGLGKHNLGTVLRGAASGKDTTFGGSPWATGPGDPTSWSGGTGGDWHGATTQAGPLSPDWSSAPVSAHPQAPAAPSDTVYL